MKKKGEVKKDSTVHPKTNPSSTKVERTERDRQGTRTTGTTRSGRYS